MVSPRTEFRIAVVREEHETLVAVAGELDVFTIVQLAERLSCLTDAGSGNVVLDLTDLTFIDAAGLATIVNVRRQLRDADRRLVVRNPSPPVRSVLQVTGLSDILDPQPALTQSSAE